VNPRQGIETHRLAAVHDCETSFARRKTVNPRQGIETGVVDLRTGAIKAQSEDSESSSGD